MILRETDWEGDGDIPNGLHRLEMIECNCDGGCGRDLDKFYSIDDDMDEQYCFDCFIKTYSKRAIRAGNKCKCSECGCHSDDLLYMIKCEWICRECIDEYFLHDLEDVPIEYDDREDF